MRQAILATAVVGLAWVVGGVDEARAQFSFGNSHFGVSIGPAYGYGSNYGYGGYAYRGFGGYGPYVGPGYGSAVNVIVPSYSRPSGGSYSRNITPPETPRERPGAGLPIKIVSPEDAGVAIRYSLNEFDYTIQPGEGQTISNDRDWVITFDRGGDFGTAEYTLSPGLYTFAATGKGWQVYHDADLSKVTKLPPPPAGKSIAKNVLPDVK